MIKHFFLKKNENKPDNGEEGPRDKEAEREEQNHNQLIFLFLGTAAFHFLFLSHAFVFLGTHFHFIYCDFLLLVTNLAVKESNVYRHLMSTIVVNMSFKMLNLFNVICLSFVRNVECHFVKKILKIFTLEYCP